MRRVIVATVLVSLFAAPAAAQEFVGFRDTGRAGIPTADSDAFAGAAESFRVVAGAWKANDERRAQFALALARKWLASIGRPEAAGLDERARQLGHAITLRALDVAPGAEMLARDATLLSNRFGGATVKRWEGSSSQGATEAAATSPPSRIVAPAGAPAAPAARPPGLGALTPSRTSARP